MRVLQNQKFLIATAVLIIVIITGYFLIKAQNHNSVYLRTITPEDGPLLSESMESWIMNNREMTSGISLYSYSGDGVYELVLIDNRHSEQDLYLHTDISAKMKDAVLEIYIQDIDAHNDTDVSYNNSSYLILKEKPSSTEVYVNGELKNADITEGDNQITQ